MSYRAIKRVVLVGLLSLVAFLCGYLLFGRKLAAILPDSHPKNSSATSNRPEGPPAPVMQEIQALKERIQENPKDEEAYSQLGDLYFQADKFSQAAPLYEKSIQLNAQDIVARNNLALCYHLLNRDSEAFQQLDTALRISPHSQHLWLTLGVVDYKTGRIPQARAAFKRAYQLSPKSDTGVKAETLLQNLR